MESLATPVPDMALEHPEVQACQNLATALKLIPGPSFQIWSRPAIQTLVQWPQNLDNEHLGKFRHPNLKPQGFQLARGRCAPGSP